MNIWTGLLLNQGHVTDEKLVRELADSSARVEADAVERARVQAVQDEREARRNLGLHSGLARVGFR